MDDHRELARLYNAVVEEQEQLDKEIEAVLEFYGNASNYRIRETYRGGEYQGIDFDPEGIIADNGRKARDLLEKIKRLRE